MPYFCFMASPLPPPQWIDSASALTQTLARLEGEPALGIDTEANSFYAYRERVCLIQISTEGEDFLIDPLAPVDLSCLGRILAEPGIVKVFHDGEYDIGILKKDFGFSFANLFDTKVAAMALGSKKFGLANVLQERYGVVLDKKYQRSDWGSRPLSQGQIEYARMDTRFLVRLYREFDAELDSANRRHVAEGEFRRLEDLRPKEQSFDPDGFVRLKGARQLDPLGLQVLKQLYLKREELASRFGVPPFRVLSNETLVELAQLRPEDEKGLTRAKGFTWKVVRRIGGEMLSSVREGERLGPIERLPVHAPQGERALRPEQVLLYEKLRQWRKAKAEKEGFDPSHVLKRGALVALAKRPPRSLAALEKAYGIEDWQIKSYGNEILSLLREAGV